jgi:hypothetical protein
MCWLRAGLEELTDEVAAKVVNKMLTEQLVLRELPQPMKTVREPYAYDHMLENGA